MLRILKGYMKFEARMEDLKTISDTSDGVYIKFMDDSELIINMKMEQKFKHVIAMIPQMSAKSITIDFNNLMNLVSVES